MNDLPTLEQAVGAYFTVCAPPQDVERLTDRLKEAHGHHDAAGFAELCRDDGISDFSTLWRQFTHIIQEESKECLKDGAQELRSALRERLQFKPRTQQPVNDLVLQQDLPVGNREAEIAAFLRGEQRFCYIQAETGAGKSTLLPKLIYKYFNVNVVVTQPRRIAAVSLAQSTGSGFIVRFERSFSGFSDRCRTVYVTDGVFLRYAAAFREAWVIVDESHERTISTDLVLAYLAQDKEFPKIIVASASDVDLWKTGERAKSKLNVIRIPGREYEVRRVYQSKTLDYRYFVVEQVCFLLTDLLVPSDLRQAFEVISHDFGADYCQCAYWGQWAVIGADSGVILAFMPGVEDIRAAHHDIQRYVRFVCAFLRENGRAPTEIPQIFQLHGQMPIGQQKAAFQAASKGSCAIIATNVAETSLTVPNIAFVVDSARCKEFVYDVEYKCERLNVELISKQSEQQRAGRAGRVRPGVYISCLTAQESTQLRAANIPEIHRKRLDGVIFDIICIIEREETWSGGDSWVLINNIQQFPFPEPPPESAIDSALSVLERIRFITVVEEQVEISKLGEVATQMSVEPELAHFLILAQLAYFSPDVAEEAAILAAFIASGDRLGANSSDTFPDDFSRITCLEQSEEARKIRKEIVLQAERAANEISDDEMFRNGQFWTGGAPTSLQALFAFSTQNIAFRTKGGYEREGEAEVFRCHSEAQAVCFNSILRDGESAWLSIVGELTVNDLDFLKKEEKKSAIK